MLCPQFIIVFLLCIINLILTIYYLYFFRSSYKSSNIITQKNGNDKLMTIITNLVYQVGMIILFYLLCEHGYNTTAWVLLLSPIILIIILIIILVIEIRHFEKLNDLNY